MYTGTYQDTNDWSVNQLRKEKQKKNKQSLWENLVITKKIYISSSCLTLRMFTQDVSQCPYIFSR